MTSIIGLGGRQVAHREAAAKERAALGHYAHQRRIAAIQQLGRDIEQEQVRDALLRAGMVV